MALLMRPSALARARASLRNCRTECNLFRTRDVWVPNWEVCFSKLFKFRKFFSSAFNWLISVQIALKQQWDMAVSEFVRFFSPVSSRLFRCLIAVLQCRLATLSWMTRGFLRHPLLLHQFCLSCNAVFENEHNRIEYMQQEQQLWRLHFYSSQTMFQTH